MVENYRIFSHTADVGLFVRGKTRADLFKSAADGMVSIFSDPEKFNPKKRVRLSVFSEDWESLLVDWLHEILYYFTVKKTGFVKFKINKISPFSIRAEGYGEKINLKKHSVFKEIKAVTRHNLKIRKTKSGYTVKIIFDI